MNPLGPIAPTGHLSSLSSACPEHALEERTLMVVMPSPVWMGMATLCVGLWWGLNSSAMAQDAVYRCGQEYTNSPRDASLCERLAPQAITVITGTRPSMRTAPVAEGIGASKARTPEVPEATATHPQRVRDALARTILSQELDKSREQLNQLVKAYNQGEPEKWAAESKNHQKYLDRVAEMKAAIERTERDIDSLQQELARRPLLATSHLP